MTEPHLVHAPRPRNPRLATEREMEAIVYLAASDGSVSATALGRDLAYDDEQRAAGACHARGHDILFPLISLELVTLPRRSRYALTERGRIAAALILFRQPGMLAAFFDEDTACEGAPAP